MGSKGFLNTLFRWGLFLLNLVLIMAGIVLVVLSVIILDNMANWVGLYRPNYEISSYVLIAAGAFTILTAFIGFWGNLKRIPWMMYAYAGVLLLLFGVNLAGAIIISTSNYTFGRGISSMMDDSAEYAKNPWSSLQTGIQRSWISNRLENMVLASSLLGYGSAILDVVAGILSVKLGMNYKRSNRRDSSGSS